MLHAGSTPFLGHKLVWKTWAPLKIKIFLWLALRRRHWTGDRRRRHGLDARELCYLYDQEEESIDHIIATCSFSREVWFFVLNNERRPDLDSLPIRVGLLAGLEGAQRTLIQEFDVDGQ